VKGKHQLAAMDDMVLGPLHGISGDDWHRSPNGKWSVAQIVAHLAAGVDQSSVTLEKRREKFGMIRRSNPGQAVLRHLLLTLGKFPPGRKAREGTFPPARPEPDIVSAQFRMGVERFTKMINEWPQSRQLEVFVKHPYLGDLNVPEWVRFHFVHARHHAKQIADRLKWGKRESGKTKRVG
jgi:hypothetical protein